jgi:hypothetical protein
MKTATQREAQAWAAQLPLAELASLYWRQIIGTPHGLRTERERAAVERLFHPASNPTKAERVSKQSGADGGGAWYRR